MTMRGLESGLSAQTAIECMRFLLSGSAAGLTGKTLSANFDPWREPYFSSQIAEINRSELLTLRRVAPWVRPATGSEIIERLAGMSLPAPTSGSAGGDDQP